MSASQCAGFGQISSLHGALMLSQDRNPARQGSQSGCNKTTFKTSESIQ